MTYEEKWQAVVQSESQYDGIFYFAVETTKIFCKPSCKSRIPLQSNIRFYDQKEEAMANGFRPCKRCRPDLVKYQPNLELLEKVKSVTNEFFSNTELFHKHLAELGISKGYLMTIFKKEFGISLLDYLRKVRVGAVKIKLLTTPNRVTQIVLESGFESMSSFYAAFQKEVRMSPRNYRKSKK